MYRQPVTVTADWPLYRMPLTVAMQVVTEMPIAWRGDRDPYTVIGDSTACPSNVFKAPCTYTNYSVSIDSLVEAGTTSSYRSGVYTQLCGRAGLKRGLAGQRPGYPLQGYCIIRNETEQTWSLTAGGAAEAFVLDSGKLASEATAAGWHTLGLSFDGDAITASIDAKIVATAHNATFLRGMMAVASGWHSAFFDNFDVRSLQR